jgi:hypothetical protein
VLAEEVVIPGGLSTTAHVFLFVGTLGSLLFILWLLRRRQLRGKYAMLWTSLGIGLAVLALFPGLLTLLSSWLGITYPPALFAVLAIGFLLVVVIHFSWELTRLEDRSRTLAEEVGLLRAELDEARRQPSPAGERGDDSA